jgi:hypothetical protein
MLKVGELFRKWCEYYDENGKLEQEEAQGIASSVDEGFLVGDSAPLDMKYVGCYRFAPDQEFLDKHEFAGVRSHGKGESAGYLNPNAKEPNILFLFATRELYKELEKESKN